MSQKVILKLLVWYKKYISGVKIVDLYRHVRNTYQAVEKYGVIKGLWLGGKGY